MSYLTRQDLRKQCADNFSTIVQGANKAKTTVANHMQSLSPIPDNKDDTRNAVADVLYYEGVILSDDAENGIEATRWSEVKEKPEWVQALYIRHMTAKARVPLATYRSRMRQFKKERDKMMQARTYDANPAGSANRPFVNTELFNSERGLEFPDPAAVIADTRFPTSSAVRVLEYKPLTSEQIARNYAEGTEVDVVTLDYNQTPVGMKRIAAGIEYSHEDDISGELTSELISEYMEERGAEVVNRRVKDAIVLLAGKARGASDANVVEIANTQDGLLQAIMGAPKRFVWTSVFGSPDAVRKYLNIDRSKFYAGPRELPSGAVVGTDVYAKAPLPRYVADVGSNPSGDSTNDYGLKADELLFIDASESVLLHILNGSELETQEFINRTRMNEIIWSASMGVSEKYPSQTNAALRPFRIYKIA